MKEIIKYSQPNLQKDKLQNLLLRKIEKDYEERKEGSDGDSPVAAGISVGEKGAEKGQEIGDAGP